MHNQVYIPISRYTEGSINQLNVVSTCVSDCVRVSLSTYVCVCVIERVCVLHK